jgi:hypothetical protein
MKKNLGAIGSSVDSSNLGATVTGLIITFSAIIIAIASHFNVPLSNTDVASFAQELGLVIGTIYTLFGLVRKLVVWVHDKVTNN